jgi:hypothetical protein
MNTITTYIGIINGFHTWEVKDSETGEIIGTNSSLYKEPPVPETISARQIRLWLVRNGIALSQIETAISSIEDPTTREVVKIEWEYAPYVERTHPWLVPLAQSLGLTPEQVDQAFIEASNI